MKSTYRLKMAAPCAAMAAFGGDGICIAQRYLCALAGGIPWPQCRLQAEKAGCEPWKEEHAEEIRVCAAVRRGKERCGPNSARGLRPVSKNVIRSCINLGAEVRAPAGRRSTTSTGDQPNRRKYQSNRPQRQRWNCQTGQDAKQALFLLRQVYLTHGKGREIVMAVTKVLARKGRLDVGIRYVLNGDKTNEQILTASQGCSTEHAVRQMMNTKRHYRQNRRRPVLSHHPVLQARRGHPRAGAGDRQRSSPQSICPATRRSSAFMWTRSISTPTPSSTP